MRTFFNLAALLVASQASVAFAHPGHGDTDPAGPIHYLTESLHIVPVAGIATLGLFFVCRAILPVVRHREA